MAEKEFLVFGDYSATFAQADAESNRLAQLLAEAGVKPGDVVGICFQNSPQAVYAQLAVMKLGAAVAWLNHNLVGNGLLHTFKLGRSKHLLFEDMVAGSIADIANGLDADTKLMCYGFSVLSPVPAAFAGREFQAFDAAALAARFSDGSVDPGIEVRKTIRLNSFAGIYFTSGTTGLPKAAYQIHSRLSTFPSVIALGFGYFTASDRIFCPLPLYHGAAQVSLNICCLVGATYVFTRRFSASTFWAEAKRTRATAMQHIGEVARYLYAVPPGPQDRAHSVTKGIGVGLRPELWKPFMDRFGLRQMLEWYGASEGVVGMFHVQQGRDGIGCVGRLGYLARRNGNVRIVRIDPDTEAIVRDPGTGLAVECRPGEPGEALGRIDPPEMSPVKHTNFDGYYGDTAATEKKIRRNVFKQGDAYMAMGDIMSIDRRGWVRFHDRIGDTFRWRGENVSTTDVAGELSQYSEDLVDCNVYGVAVPGQDGRAGMAAVSLRKELSPAELEGFMRGMGRFAAERLPSYAVPRFVRVVKEIELTGTFKQRKVEYVKQGFDPAAIREPMFWFDAAKKSYEPFGPVEHRSIVAGKAKL
ncbi:hypothetical protein DFJ74DRAFT_604984 [Hyaloraphidium curvatum]|nr:hypothetical protein DFJ74DRAFT_604984 [Hyaloraphidium curvatum]